MNANHTHPIKFVGNTNPSKACHRADVMKGPSGASHCSARHQSVSRVSRPMMPTTEYVVT